ncbi:MAG TPA: efflux RND transporter periplasmic adaptor subunit [Polyangiales bacterium]|nr:efflux RND transporter periplasmic adaptor subunit [Polyangiales bacterium]
MPSAEIVAQPLARTPLVQVIRDEERRHKRQLLTGLLATLAVIALVVAAYYSFRPKPPPFADRFRVQPVTLGDVVREVHATGHAEAVTTVQVGAEISGRIASVEADFNQHVQKDQVLARFDHMALQAQLAQTAAALAVARTALEQAKTERIQALRSRSRALQLHQQGSLPDADRDVAEANAELAVQRVESAQAQVAAQSATYELARTNLSHTEIRSPIDGIVITRTIDPGQSVASVLQSPTLFSVAADLRMMRVIGAIDEADVGEVHEGQTATFSVSAYPEREFLGKVTEVRNAPSVVQDVITYGTVIAADNADLALKPGMTASVRIRTARAEAVTRVPIAALHFNPPGTDARTTHGVWMVDGQSLRHVPVKVGISDGEYTAVEAADLPPGTAVIVELSAVGRTAYGLGK